MRYFFILFALLGFLKAPTQDIPVNALVKVDLYSQSEVLGSLFFLKNQLKEAVDISEASGEYFSDPAYLHPQHFKLCQAATVAILQRFTPRIEGPFLPGLVPDSEIEFPPNCMKCTVPFKWDDGKWKMYCVIDYDTIPNCVLRGLRGQGGIQAVVSLPRF